MSNCNTHPLKKTSCSKTCSVQTDRYYVKCECIAFIINICLWLKYIFNTYCKLFECVTLGLKWFLSFTQITFNSNYIFLMRPICHCLPLKEETPKKQSIFTVQIDLLLFWKGTNVCDICWIIMSTFLFFSFFNAVLVSFFNCLFDKSSLRFVKEYTNK